MKTDSLMTVEKRPKADLKGERLHQMQQSLANKKYLIIDEMSMVGRKVLGQVDKRLRQGFPRRAVFRGCSCLLLETLVDSHQ